jgi:nucleotide-binding universal stress UspA family protein
MFTNVVWATDGSERSDRALEYAADIAERDGAELHVVHVVEKLLGGRVAGQNIHLDEEQLDEKITRQTRELADRNVKADLRMTPGRSGDVAHGIADVAIQTSADLIVVGTRGHSALVGMLAGSVTQRLLHVAPCPVLAVPPLMPAGHSTPAAGDHRSADDAGPRRPSLEVPA